MGYYLLNKVARILEEKRDVISAIKDEKIVLYPYGEIGVYVESWLHENFKIVPAFYIDNFKADGEKILNLKQAATRAGAEFVVLIASDSQTYYEEIRNNLYKELPDVKVVDLFEKAKGDFSTLRKEISIEVENTKKLEPIIVRKAYALAEYFDKKDIVIKSESILYGTLERIELFDMAPMNTQVVIDACKDVMGFELSHYMLSAEKEGVFCSNMGKHIIPAYEIFLRDGIQNQIDKIKIGQKRSLKEEQRVVNKSQLIVLEAFQGLILRYAEEIRNQKVVDFENRYDSLKNIANNPPRNFWEAVQLLLFLHIAIIDEAASGSISFGRLDRILYPYYERDILDGKITKEQAEEIIVELYKKISNMERSWQNVTLGGSDEFGNDESNELTIMCLNASLQVHADQPQVSLRVNERMPQQLWDKAFEVIKTGRGIPSLFNDKVAVEAKMSAGVSKEDAWDYGIVGCVELSAGGKEYSHTEGMRINWAKIIELMIYGDEHELLSKKYSLEMFSSFEDFYEAYKVELAYVTKRCCDFLECARKVYAKKWPTPFTSCLMEGCIEAAKDVTDNGTIYNNMTINAVGVASTVDSLQAIETLVYQKKSLTFEQLKEALENNFEGDTSICEVCTECEKFGNDIEEVDEKAVDLVRFFTKIVREYESDISGVYQVGYYTSYFHSDFGKKTKALPDGKKSGTPLSSSLSPVSGMDSNGPIAVLNSLNKIEMTEMANGMVLDMKFVKSFFDKEENRFGLQELIKTYFQRGGMEIQFNIVDRQTLIEAQNNPFKYRNLIVRVSGFSSYFVDLDKDLQNEIISRTANV